MKTNMNRSTIINRMAKSSPKKAIVEHKKEY